VSNGAGSAFGETFSRNGNKPSGVSITYKVATSSVCGRDASITSPTDSAWRRATHLQVRPLKATLAVPRPLPVVIFERLRLMRASFAVLSLSQGASFLFFHMPPFRSLRAVESHWREQGRVTRSRRRADERRQAETALKDGPLQFFGNQQITVGEAIRDRASPA
jgi:hypothetical protein